MRLAIKTFVAFVIIVGAGFAAPAVADPHPFSAEDLVSFRRISDIQISPDGDQLAFVLREQAPEQEATRLDVWLMDVSGRQFVGHRATSALSNNSNPRFSPDGRFLYFLSARSGSSQVWMLPLDGGEARQITDLPVAISNLELSPAGNRIAFSAAVYPGCPNLKCSADRAAAEEKSPETGQLYDQLMVRYWDAWRNGQEVHLFTGALDDAGVMPGEPVDISAPLSGDVPFPPFGGTESYAFSADGREIYFSLKQRSPDEPWSINSDIYRAISTGMGDPVNLTADNPARDDNPIVSSNGRYLAWLASEGAARWTGQPMIMLRDLRSGETRRLAENWDRRPDGIAFAENDRSIFATSNHLGQKAIWRIPLSGGEPDLMYADGNVGDIRPERHAVYFTRSNLAEPADIFRLRLRDQKVERLTLVNQNLLDEIKTGPFEQFSFAGADGERVYGYVVEPVERRAGRKYPVAFIVHGGPHGSMGNNFHYRWNPQVYAGAGYGVVFIDFHGSTGYGQAFVESIIEDRGGKPLEDLKLGLAAAVEKYPWLDGERVCALGASFGGYMINWIAGAWPDRFRCLVDHDGIFDNRMKYYTSDLIGYLEEGFGGVLYNNPEGHEEHNPARLVSEWRTPMLVIHGGHDYRVPVTQGIATFSALQRRGIPSRFLYFPDENHWVMKPANSLQWHREVLAWLDRWLKETPAAGVSSGGSPPQ